MIKPVDDTILLLNREGEAEPFDPTELRTGLLRCFLAAGFGENSYLADDIALAVEYSLTETKQRDRLFERSEMINVVLKVLESSGFWEVAELFRERCDANDELDCPVSAAAIKEFLQRNFSAVSQLDELTKACVKALKKLHLDIAAPGLIIELARALHRQSLTPPAAPAAAEQTPGEQPLYWVKPGQIAAALSSQAQKYLQNRVVRETGVSRIFPCIKLYVNLTNFVRSEKLSGMLTELNLEPRFAPLAAALDELCAATRAAYALANPAPGGELPIYLQVPDMPSFVRRYLGGEWPESRKAALDLAKSLGDLMTMTLQKVQIENE